VKPNDFQVAAAQHLAPEPETLDRATGIRAIIALQKMAGVTETEESAGATWDSFDEDKQRRTLKAHAFFAENKWRSLT
jgi:hypothetical protein